MIHELFYETINCTYTLLPYKYETKYHEKQIFLFNCICNNSTTHSYP